MNEELCFSPGDFWPVYKSRSIFWTDFQDLKG